MCFDSTDVATRGLSVLGSLRSPTTTDPPTVGSRRVRPESQETTSDTSATHSDAASRRWKVRDRANMVHDFASKRTDHHRRNRHVLRERHPERTRPCGILRSVHSALYGNSRSVPEIPGRITRVAPMDFRPERKRDERILDESSPWTPRFLWTTVIGRGRSFPSDTPTPETKASRGGLRSARAAGGSGPGGWRRRSPR